MAFSHYSFLRSGLTGLLLLAGTVSNGQTDSLSAVLDSASIVSRKHSGQLSGSPTGTFRWNSDLMQYMPKILGSADPVRLSRFLPGVQTGSELDGGIHILGSDTSQSDISIDGVPVYGVSHLLGLFSSFNPSHFPEFSFCLNPGIESRGSGGMFRAELPCSVPSGVKGDFNVGLLAVQGTLGIPLGRKSAAYLSARRSFINLLYGRFLEIEGTALKYSFQDYNLTFFSEPAPSDKLWFTAGFGNDSALSGDGEAVWRFGLDWGNTFAGLHHRHSFANDGVLDNRVYCTGYANKGNLDMSVSAFSLASSILTAGHKADYETGSMHAFSGCEFHWVTPQSVSLPAPYSSVTYNPLFTTELWAGLSECACIGDRLKVEPGLKAVAFMSSCRQAEFLLCPGMNVSCNLFHLGRISASYAWNVQNIYKTGLSDLGLPVEFWLSAGFVGGPQKSQKVSLEYEVGLASDSYTFSVQASYADLYNLVDYSGTILGLLDSTRLLEDDLSVVDGWNCNLSLMLSKHAGKLTGWVGYAFCRSLRNGVPSDFERLHELDLVASYRTGRLDLSSTFVCASGLPYTPAKSIYPVSGIIMADYGERNSGRLKPYVRLDLSASYDFIREDDRCFGADISIYNVLCGDNPLCYRLKVFPSKSAFRYSAMSLGLKFLPSASLYYKF